MVNYLHLARSTQAYRLSFDLQSPRAWQLVDVNFDGSDGDAPALDPISPLGPANEFRLQDTVVAAFDGITDLIISGSIDQGGMATTLSVPQVPAEFPDYFGVGISIQTWHGNIPGVIGAAGVDYDGAPLYQGYMRSAQARATSDMRIVDFSIRSTASFWQDSSFTRGIDFATGLAHGAPGTPEDVVRHMVDAHTNTSPRSVVGIYLPAHDLGTAYSLNRGSMYQMIKQVADNACLIGWVAADREDNIQVTGHPNMIGDLYPDYHTPIIDLDDGMILEWDSVDQPPRQVAQCSITMIHSDQTEEVINGYALGGLGSRDFFTIRSDDINVANDLNARYLAHGNRRYPSLRLRLSLVVAIDLFDMVTVTSEARYNNRGINWNMKKFVVTGLEYQVESQEQRFSSWVTLDEVVG